MLEALEVYRHGLLVQSDATVRSTLFQYRVGKVPFASVLEVMRGLVADEGGYSRPSPMPSGCSSRCAR